MTLPYTINLHATTPRDLEEMNPNVVFYGSFVSLNLGNLSIFVTDADAARRLIKELSDSLEEGHHYHE